MQQTPGPMKGSTETAPSDRPLSNRPGLGFGLGLRPAHYPAIESGDVNVDWFEIISENFIDAGGPPRRHLDAIAERFPIVMHGVSLSIGSTDPLDRDYLAGLKRLIDHVNPAWVSDHLCWTGWGGVNMHDLLPLPQTEEAVMHVARRLREVQDILGRRILMENVSSYVSYADSTLTEWDFLAAVADEADCLILLDVNNIYVSAFNHGFDPDDYLAGVPGDRIWQVHIAGHTDNETHIIDTHDHPVSDPVWDIYAKAIGRFGSISTMIERDDNIPPLADLIAELDIARRIAAEAVAPKPGQVRA